jgi:hypothetical protein
MERPTFLLQNRCKLLEKHLPLRDKWIWNRNLLHWQHQFMFENVKVLEFRLVILKRLI